MKRGADIELDHHLLVAKLELKKKWMKTTTKRHQYSVGLLRDTLVQEEYRLKFSDMFQVLQEL